MHCQTNRYSTIPTKVKYLTYFQLFISTIMGILVFVTDNLLKVISLGILSKVILDVIIGIIIYIILSLITKNKNFKYFLDMLKKIFTKKGDV